MWILSIETTGPQCSVALIDEKGTTTEMLSEGTLNHLQNLIPMTETLLSNSRLQIDDISAVAASCGPGSFTGIRIGVATARALCQAAGKPAIAVPTLKSFAYHAENCGGIIASILDARREQVYGGAYLWKNGQISEQVAGGAYPFAEFLVLLKEACQKSGMQEICFFGDGCGPYGEAAADFCCENGINARISGITQRASSVAKLARSMYQQGMLLPYGKLMPEYMRKAEAERKLEEKRKQTAGGKAENEG